MHQQMIHAAFNKSVVALRYYMYMGLQLTRQQAIKRFIQDGKKIDKATLQLVISGIFEEQKRLIK